MNSHGAQGTMRLAALAMSSFAIFLGCAARSTAPARGGTSPIAAAPRDDESDDSLSAGCGKGDAARRLALGKRIGKHDSPRHDLVRAGVLLRRGCDLGSDDACVALAQVMMSARGSDHDVAGAKALLERTCDKGFADACTNLAGIILNGPPLTPKDPAAAIAPYERGCGAGMAQACTNLGVIYSVGMGVPKDDTRAKSYFEAGCLGGDGSGCKNVEILAQCKAGSAEACAAFDHLRDVP